MNTKRRQMISNNGRCYGFFPFVLLAVFLLILSVQSYGDVTNCDPDDPADTSCGSNACLSDSSSSSGGICAGSSASGAFNDNCQCGPVDGCTSFNTATATSATILGAVCAADDDYNKSQHWPCACNPAYCGEMPANHCGVALTQCTKPGCVVDALGVARCEAVPMDPATDCPAVADCQMPICDPVTGCGFKIKECDPAIAGCALDADGNARLTSCSYFGTAYNDDSSGCALQGCAKKVTMKTEKNCASKDCYVCDVPDYPSNCCTSLGIGAPSADEKNTMPTDCQGGCFVGATCYKECPTGYLSTSAGMPDSKPVWCCSCNTMTEICSSSSTCSTLTSSCPTADYFEKTSCKKTGTTPSCNAAGETGGAAITIGGGTCQVEVTCGECKCDSTWAESTLPTC